MVAKLWVLSHDFHFLCSIINIIDLNTLVLDDEWLIPCSVLLCWLWFNGFCYAVICHSYSNVIHSLSLAQMITHYVWLWSSGWLWTVVSFGGSSNFHKDRCFCSKFSSVLSLFRCKQEYLCVLADILYEKYMQGINL